MQCDAYRSVAMCEITQITHTTDPRTPTYALPPPTEAFFLASSNIPADKEYRGGGASVDAEYCEWKLPASPSRSTTDALRRGHAVSYLRAVLHLRSRRGLKLAGILEINLFVRGMSHGRAFVQQLPVLRGFLPSLRFGFAFEVNEEEDGNISTFLQRSHYASWMVEIRDRGRQPRNLLARFRCGNESRDGHLWRDRRDRICRLCHREDYLMRRMNSWQKVREEREKCLGEILGEGGKGLAELERVIEKRDRNQREDKAVDKGYEIYSALEQEAKSLQIIDGCIESTPEGVENRGFLREATHGGQQERYPSRVAVPRVPWRQWESSWERTAVETVLRGFERHWVERSSMVSVSIHGYRSWESLLWGHKWDRPYQRGPLCPPERRSIWNPGHESLCPPRSGLPIHASRSNAQNLRTTVIDTRNRAIIESEESETGLGKGCCSYECRSDRVSFETKHSAELHRKPGQNPISQA
ncbi:hypothetical protein WN48_04808 [Eufriesea mexicana]|uniref:Uncharacterized protein n=1 Tax=Eufriesea mexicana TaxID=516756 RepID=A0A310SE32_9HYME|nr:hypothetical protein WN48_04808 [Eufriesea mexicana]